MSRNSALQRLKSLSITTYLPNSNLVTSRHNAILPSCTSLLASQNKRGGTQSSSQSCSLPFSRSMSTTSFLQASLSRPQTKPKHSKLSSHDRGPVSGEDTQTDFGKMDVLGNMANPSTSVDICTFDGFVLDSGLKIGDGDGVVLSSLEAFVWRPWMASRAAGEGEMGVKVLDGNSFRGGETEMERTGWVLNELGQWDIGGEAWAIFKLLWPKPDLLIIGTGPSIRPLSPWTREYLQSLGLRIEVLDTRNAASQFNLLSIERGVQEVAAALVPIGFGQK